MCFLVSVSHCHVLSIVVTADGGWLSDEVKNKAFPSALYSPYKMAADEQAALTAALKKVSARVVLILMVAYKCVCVGKLTVLFLSQQDEEQRSTKGVMFEAAKRQQDEYEVTKLY